MGSLGLFAVSHKSLNDRVVKDALGYVMAVVVVLRGPEVTVCSDVHLSLSVFY